MRPSSPSSRTVVMALLSVPCWSGVHRGQPTGGGCGRAVLVCNRYWRRR
uniref:Uncharacterized protein n=1 Tax=uncultured marine microorganism HF4000_APKG7H23 TaxID=455551 RepID=B3T9U4_9ZZZZ|nr:hypothetical protein ALOHA_HF4000APKG7H23ctg3g18 [uncultured marine microorganism HF4000_APKG7H23]